MAFSPRKLGYITSHLIWKTMGDNTGLRPDCPHGGHLDKQNRDVCPTGALAIRHPIQRMCVELLCHWLTDLQDAFCKQL